MSPKRALTDSEKIEVLMGAVDYLTRLVTENHEEVLEKLNNINLGGSDYGVEKIDEYDGDE